MKELFTDWKPQVPYERVPLEYRDIPPDQIAIRTPDKENAVFFARQNVDMLDEDADFPALYLANYILGGGAGFDSRLGARIRQKDGLSYGVGSEFEVGSLDRAGAYSAYAIAAPANMAKVDACVGLAVWNMANSDKAPEWNRENPKAARYVTAHDKAAHEAK